MKNIKFIITAACLVLFAACQDKGEWDVPGVSTAPQYGNNDIQETNVKSIRDVISTYATTIANDDMKEITQDLQVKGRVTGNDISGNFYKKITIQDESLSLEEAGALTISIDESGLWSYLPLGAEVLVDLKGLWIGGYGKTPTIGTPYTSNKGATSVGRMSKHLWAKHFKLTGSIKKLSPMVVGKDDLSKLNELVNGVPKHAGKLLRLQNVTFRNADGVSTFKSGTESNLTGYFIQCLNEFYVSGTDDKKQTVQIFTSGDYAKFSSMILPFDADKSKPIACDLIGIGGYYNGLWQISIIENAPNGIVVPSTGPAPSPTPSAGYSVDFKTNGLGEWTIYDKTKPAEVDAVWKYNNKYGMVATAFASSTNYASESWIISPKFDLGAVTTLTLHHAINYFTSVDVAKTQAVIAISTDGTNWTDLTLTGWPAEQSWKFFDSTADVSAFANKKNLQLAVKYISTAEKAGTWEVEKIDIQ